MVFWACMVSQNFDFMGGWIIPIATLLTKNELYIWVEIWRVIFLHDTLLVPSSAPVRRLYNVIVGPKIFLEIVFVQQSLSCMIHQHTFGIPTFPCIF